MRIACLDVFRIARCRANRRSLIALVAFGVAFAIAPVAPAQQDAGDGANMRGLPGTVQLAQTKEPSTTIPQLKAVQPKLKVTPKPGAKTPAAFSATLKAPPAAAAQKAPSPAAAARTRRNVTTKDLNWVCAGRKCKARGPAAAFSVGSCQSLARQVGALAAFSRAWKGLSGPQLTRCNTAAAAEPRLAAKTPAAFSATLKAPPAAAAQKAPSPAAAARTRRNVTTKDLNWVCAGRKCKARGPAAAFSVGSCQSLARQVGALAVFSRAGKELLGPQLTRCNTAAAAGPRLARPGILAQSKGGAVTSRLSKSVAKAAKKKAEAPMPKKTELGTFVRQSPGTIRELAKRPTQPPRRKSGGFVPRTAPTGGKKPGGTGGTGTTTAGVGGLGGAVRPGGVGGVAPVKVRLPAVSAARMRNLINAGVGLYGVSPAALRRAAQRTPRYGVYHSGGNDCNDSHRGIHPGAPEVCNGYDNNCDGLIDDGLRGMAYYDRDNDRYGDPDSGTLVCLRDFLENPQLVNDNTDCDDTDITVNPLMGNCPPGR